METLKETTPELGHIYSTRKQHETLAVNKILSYRQYLEVKASRFFRFCLKDIPPLNQELLLNGIRPDKWQLY